VLHDCDVCKCVNPDHLFLGTQQDNMIDRDQKGRNRQPKGENHSRAKVSDTQVAEIRSSSLSRKALAGLYNLSPGHIYQIRKGVVRCASD